MKELQMPETQMHKRKMEYDGISLKNSGGQGRESFPA
jgi:hypothetical protein